MNSPLPVFAILFALLLGAIACSDDPDPISLTDCDPATCTDGRFCDTESDECRCDETSCGEAMRCVDGDTCVDDASAMCSFGTSWDDESGCRCDDDVCGDAGWSCTDDGAHCEFDDFHSACIDGATPWDGTHSVFRDASSDAGLVDLGVEGIRVSSADVTGNGAPDLLVRRPLAGADDFSEDGDRQSWLLANDGSGVFTDITEESGLMQRRYDDDPQLGRPAEVIAFADIDNSGALDAVTLTSNFEADANPEGAEVLFNDGDGNFELAPTSDGLHAAGEVVARGGVAFMDVDRDGFVDLWIGSGAPPGMNPQQDLLFLGDGSGQFVDATDDRGLSAESWGDWDVLNEARGHTNAWSVAACDLDANGYPELLSASYGRAPNHLWSAQPGEMTTFENHSIDSGYAFDHRDDWTDNESARCYCEHNRSAPDCADVPSPQYIQCDSAADAFRWNHHSDREPFRLGGNSGTTVCADLNNNGKLDLLTTEIVHWDVGSSSDPSEILYNTGDSPPRFERPGNDATGLTRSRDGIVWDDGDITAAAFDFDNDGRLDILIASTDYPGTRAHLYHQQQDGTFERVPVDLGIDLTSAHGVSVGDFNQNGALDVAIGHSRARCDAGDHCLDDSHVRLFENEIGADNNWLQLELEGAAGTNRAAIGARIEVITDDLTRASEVDGGHGHYGMQHGLVQHFGLGDNCDAKVIIRWPDAEGTEEVYRLSAGHRYQIRQGEPPAVMAD